MLGHDGELTFSSLIKSSFTFNSFDTVEDWWFTISLIQRIIPEVCHALFFFLLSILFSLSQFFCTILYTSAHVRSSHPAFVSNHTLQRGKNFELLLHRIEGLVAFFELEKKKRKKREKKKRTATTNNNEAYNSVGFRR